MNGGGDIFERKLPAFTVDIPIKFVMVFDLFEGVAVGVGKPVDFGAGKSVIGITNADNQIAIFI